MADLCTADQVTDRLNLSAGTDATLIGQLIDEVSSFINDLLAPLLLTPEDNTAYIVDTAYGSAIRWPRGIRSVDLLEVATTDQPDTGGTYTAVDAADVLLRPSSAFRRPGWPATTILLRGPAARLRSALNGARVTGDHGFAAIPDVIEGVAIDAVVTAYNSRQGPTDAGIGEGANPAYPWAAYFGPDTSPRRTLERFRAGSSSLGIG